MLYKIFESTERDILTEFLRLDLLMQDRAVYQVHYLSEGRRRLVAVAPQDDSESTHPSDISFGLCVSGVIEESYDLTEIILYSDVEKFYSVLSTTPPVYDDAYWSDYVMVLRSFLVLFKQWGIKVGNVNFYGHAAWEPESITSEFGSKLYSRAERLAFGG